MFEPIVGIPRQLARTLPDKQDLVVLGFRLSQTTRAILLVLGGIKGGIGKSTSTFFLAACYARLGLRVLVLDVDPKAGSARKWARLARHDGVVLSFDVKSHPSDDLREKIEEEGWLQQYDIIIMDTGGDNDRILQRAYELADVFLMTSSPSPMDQDNLLDTANIAAKAGDRGIPVRLLIVNARSPKMVRDTKRELRAAGIPVLTHVIPGSVGFQAEYGKNPTKLKEYDAVRHELDQMEAPLGPDQDATSSSTAV